MQPRKLFIENGRSRVSPFFYIIRHRMSGTLYAGYVMQKNRCNSKTFMTDHGYQTSSRQVKAIIESEGLDVFEVDRVRHFESGKLAHIYETRFLHHVNAKNNSKFFNNSNGQLNFNTIGNGFVASDYTREKIGKNGKGRIWWNDGTKSKWCKEKPEGNQWEPGRLPFSPESSKKKASASRGKLCWNNGVINKRCRICPGKGWTLGAMLSNETRKRIGNMNRDKTWWNNGSETAMLKECPPGWFPGRLVSDSQLKRWSDSKVGLLSWTNGVVNVRAKEKPEGDEWISGMTKAITNQGKHLWNNGIVMKMSSDKPGDGWVHGKI